MSFRPEIAKVSHQLKTHPFFKQWMLIGCIVGMFFIVVVYDLIHELHELKIENIERLQAQAQLVDDNLTSQLRSANIAIAGIVKDIPVWQQQSVNQASITRRLTALSDTLAGTSSLSVLDKNGIVTSSSQASLVGQGLGQRAYFRQAKEDAKADRLYISPPFISVTGKYVIALARTVLDASGQFAGLVVASLDPQYFHTLMSSVLYSGDMWSALIHEDGSLFVLEPKTASSSSLSLGTQSSLFMRHHASGSTVSVQEGFSTASRDQRLIVFHTVQPVELQMDRALVVAISRSEAAIMQGWYETAYVLGSTLFIVCLLAIGLQYYYQRNQQAYAKETLSAQNAMHQAESRFITAFSEAPIGMALMDLEGRFLQTNRALGVMLGFSDEEMTRKTFRDLTHPDDLSADTELKDELLQGRRTSYQIEKRYIHRNCHIVWALASVSAVTDPNGQITYLIKQVQDISLLKSQANELEHLAHHDKLTGLPNRTLLADRMQQTIAQAQRSKRMFAVGFLDLDGFKPINDTYGHAAGDEVLVACAARMLDCVRSGDTVSRLGGDEFVFLLTRISNEAECLQVVERMREAIEAPIRLRNETTVHVSASFGICFYPADGESPDILLRCADRAMYAAKDDGGRSHCFFSKTLEN